MFVLVLEPDHTTCPVWCRRCLHSWKSGAKVIQCLIESCPEIEKNRGKTRMQHTQRVHAREQILGLHIE